ncbi:MAG: alpha/beta fold hydrolase [Deltaproteobacteria bacterium]|nr:alpha/beta fold hydrolase [Deltaproteobacteria bacterium]MBW2444286.1 alpha/beta fold hydrolase [Deltaproteobacteria bacterium]
MELHVEAHGEGPLVVLGHGFGGSARNWRPQVRASRATHRMVVFDARGHARSAAPVSPRAYSITSLTADLAGVVEAEAGGVPAVVGGLSMGAGIALQYALDAPEQLRGLVLMAPPPAGDASHRGRGWAADFAAAIDREGLDAAGERFAWGEGSGLDRAGGQLVRQGFLEHPPYALAHVLRGVLDAWPPLDVQVESLRRLRIPTLLVVGSRDGPSLRRAQDLAEVMPDARLEVAADAGHVVNLAARERVNELLSGFLAELA